MADAIDQGCAREALDREMALRVRRHEGPVACGVCHNCGESVEPPLRWCDAQCRDDWERSHA